MRRALCLAAIAVALLPGSARADAAEASRRAKSGAFDAEAEVGCAQSLGQALGRCHAGVARVDSAAAVRVRFGNGFARVLVFEAGAFRRGDATMSGSGTDTDWTLFDGQYRIRVDDQRYVLPAPLVTGAQAAHPEARDR
jgi:hypothetical protein